MIIYSKKQFNFFKSLDKAKSEVESLHPCTYGFWENEEIKNELMNYLKDFSRERKAYDKQTLPEIDATTKNIYGEILKSWKWALLTVFLKCTNSERG